jgi:hypothetical protein
MGGDQGSFSIRSAHRCGATGPRRAETVQNRHVQRGCFTANRRDVVAWHQIAPAAAQDGDVSWLAVSLVASVVLTIVVNVVLWLFPHGARRLHESLGRLANERPADRDEDQPSRMRVIFPWRLMIIGSLVLTVVANVLLRLFR